MTSIVILNWNGAKMMRKYLPSVVKNSPGAEVVVADNASTDDSLELLRNEFPEVRTIVLEKNWGFADGYNKALEALNDVDADVDANFLCTEGKTSKAGAYADIDLSDYYLLLNSDVRVEEGWLKPLEEYMDSHPECAACQPKLLSDMTPNYFEYAGACGGLLDCYGYPYCRGRIFDTVEEDKGQYDSVMPVLWATGACLMIRREDYWKAGGLDGRFFAHNEEIDLCWRLNIMGRKVVCVPQSRVYHLGGGTLPKGNPRKTYLNFRNNLTMLYKNLPDSELNKVMRMRLFLDYLAAFQMLILGKSWGDFKAVIKGRHDFKAWRKDFEADRKKIQAMRNYDVDDSVLCTKDKASRAGANDTGRTTFSILWQYYVMGCKKYSQL